LFKAELATVSFDAAKAYAGCSRINLDGRRISWTAAHDPQQTHRVAIDFDFVVVTNHATLGRATIHQVAARSLAIVSFELRVEVLMPFIVTYPIVSVLRCRACKKKHGEPASKQCREVLPFT
jgi:hypothetical protein